jgi:hypothetical protein
MTVRVTVKELLECSNPHVIGCFEAILLALLALFDMSVGFYWFNALRLGGIMRSFDLPLQLPLTIEVFVDSGFVSWRLHPLLSSLHSMVVKFK